MNDISELNSPQMVEAVRLWTGWGHCMMPDRNDKRVAEHFGDEVAAELLPLIRSLEDDFYSSDARLVAANLHEMNSVASAQFRQKHPTVSDDIVKAFAWCYTFDYK